MITPQMNRIYLKQLNGSVSFDLREIGTYEFSLLQTKHGTNGAVEKGQKFTLFQDI